MIGMNDRRRGWAALLSRALAAAILFAAAPALAQHLGPDFGAKGDDNQGSIELVDQKTLRVCADPEISILQVITTQLILWLAVLLTIWAAGKIFRVGVLMYGKPPSLGQVVRWLRYA